MAMNAGLNFRGKLIIETFDGRLQIGKWEADNTVCIAGLTDVAGSLAYLGVQDIAADIGTSPYIITPLYGALGIGDVTSTPPSVADVQLVNELTRVTATASGFAPALGSNPGQAVWQFQFPINNFGGDYTLSEAGVFVLAESTTNSGDLLDHAAFNPLATWPAGQSLVLSLQLSLYAVAW
jgi:hypothetical protein